MVHSSIMKTCELLTWK